MILFEKVADCATVEAVLNLL